MSLFLTVVVTLIAMLLANLVLLFVVSRRLARKEADLIAGIRQYFAPQGTTASKFQQDTDIVVSQFVTGLADVLEAKYMGMRSGQVRAEKAVENEVTEAILAKKAPWMAAVIGQVPGLKKTIMKNPEVAMAAIEKFASMGKGAGEQPDNDDGNSSTSITIE